MSKQFPIKELKEVNGISFRNKFSSELLSAHTDTEKIFSV